jgi:hypothetical protein
MLPNSDFRDLLRAFNDEGVRYLVVGGYAFMLYSSPRFTKDLDVWVEPSAENGERVFQALRRFGAPLRGISASDFTQPGQIYQLGVEPNRIDVLTSIESLDFAAAWECRQEAEFDNLRAWFLSRKDLIRNKRAVGRPQDLIDADLLDGKSEK